MKGSVRKRGSTWSYYFDLGVINGKRKKIERGGFKTKKAAETALAEALNKYNATGTTFTPSEITFADYLDYYLNNYVKVNLQLNSVTSAEQVHNNHLKPALGNYKLKALTPALLQEYINGLAEKYAKATVELIISALISALNYAVEPMQYIQDNPAKNLRHPKTNKKKKEKSALTAKDWRTIIGKYPSGSKFHLVLMLGYYCGLRVNEALGLTWDDIDFEKRELSINKQLYTYNKRQSRDRNAYITVKTSKGKRTIKFGQALYDALQQEAERINQRTAFYGDFYTVQYVEVNNSDVLQIIEQRADEKAPQGYKKIAPVCIFENGQQMCYNNILSLMQSIKRAGFPDFSYHTLRHTHATILCENNVPIKAIQERLGHASINTTLAVYAHVTKQAQDDAVKVIENSILG